MAVREVLSEVTSRINPNLIDNAQCGLEAANLAAYGALEFNKLTGCSGLPRTPQEFMGFATGAIIGFGSYLAIRNALLAIEEELEVKEEIRRVRNREE